MSIERELKMLTQQTTSETIAKEKFIFTREMKLNLDDLYDRVLIKRKASLIIIDGSIGEGKTTLAVHLADYINKKHGQKEINLKTGNQLGLGGEDFLKKLRWCYENKYHVCIYDEAGDFSKRGSLTKFNAMLNRTFEMFRAFQIIVIIVLPSFSVLDNDIFDKGIPRMLVHCYDRSLTAGRFKVYDFITMMYIRHAMKKEVIKQRVYDRYNPNIHGDFVDLTPERSTQLDEISTAGKISSLQSSELKIAGLINSKELAIKTAKSRNWVNESIKALGIKPLRVINRTRYYSEDILEVLNNYYLIPRDQRPVAVQPPKVDF